MFTSSKLLQVGARVFGAGCTGLSYKALSRDQVVRPEVVGEGAGARQFVRVLVYKNNPVAS